MATSNRTFSTNVRTAALGGAIAAAALLSNDAFAADVRAHAVVHSDQVRLSDLFDGIGPQGDTVVFRAPAPGRSITLNTRSLQKLAQAYKLDWRPRSGFEAITVKRSSNPVDQTVIAAALHDSLREHVADSDDYEIALDDPTVRIDLPVHMPAKAAVRDMHYDPRSRRFSATIIAPDNRPGAARTAVAGRVHRLVGVPVLSRRMRHGDIIRASDLKTRKVRATALDRNALTEHAHIVGKSARRSLHPDRPIRGGDVREPMLVQRGNLVTMTYQTASMVITAQGKAREHGAKGDTVRVLNTNSGKIVEATVTGFGKVAVGPIHNVSVR